MKKYLNLNPSSIEKNKKKDIGKSLIIIYILLTFLLIINCGVIYLNNKSLEKGNETLKEQIKNYKFIASDYKDIKTDIKNKEKFINKLKQINRDVSAYDYLDTLKKYFPNNVALEEIKFTTKGISMEGTADNEKDVAVFLANLQMSKLYKNARVISMKDIKINLDNTLGNEDNISDNKVDKDNLEKQPDNKEQKAINKVQFTISVEGVKDNG